MTDEKTDSAAAKSTGLAEARRIFTSWPIKFIGTLVCIWLLIHNIDVAEALKTLRHANLGILAGVIALTALVQLCGMLEWAILVRSNSSISWRLLGYVFFKSLAAQHLIPTGFGGDALRIYEVGKIIGIPAATAASAVGRLSSTTALMIWAMLGAMQVKGALGDWTVTLSALCVISMLSLWVVAMFPNTVTLKLVQFTKRFGTRAPRAIINFASKLKELRTNPQTLAACLGASLLGWGLQFLTLSVLASAVGLHIGWHLFAVSFPFSLVATVAPFALNGYGLREGILIGILVSAGINPGQAAALALLVDLQMVPFFLASSLLWLGKRNRQTTTAAVKATTASVQADLQKQA